MKRIVMLIFTFIIILSLCLPDIASAATSATRLDLGDGVFTYLLHYTPSDPEYDNYYHELSYWTNNTARLTQHSYDISLFPKGWRSALLKFYVYNTDIYDEDNKGTLTIEFYGADFSHGYGHIQQEVSGGDFFLNYDITNKIREMQANNEPGLKIVMSVRSSNGMKLWYYTPYFYVYGPFTPINLTATSEQTSVTLSWDANKNNSGTEYEVYNGSSLVGTTTSTSYTINGLNPGTTYTFKVRTICSDSSPSDFASINKSTRPPTPSAPTGTVSGLSWSPTEGRGRVQLSWQPVTGATGYAVWVFDGNTYRRFDVGNSTNWDSSTARIYPPESQLNGYGDNTQSEDLFYHNNGGLDLRDDPNKLYRKTVGTAYDNAHNYWFRVSAYNSSGESPYSETYVPTLPNRTDPTPPTGSVSINGGANATNSATVTLNLSATDTGGSGVSQVRFSNDNSIWSDWTTYNATKPWTLTSGSGTKTIYAQFKDAAGNISNTYTDSITLDTTPPTGSITINSGNNYTTIRNLNLTLSASDNMQISKMKFKIDNGNWDNPINFTSPYTLAVSGNGNHTIYVTFIDSAGNESTVYSDTIYLDETTPKIDNFSINGGAEWTNDNIVTLNISANDTDSGLSQIQFSNDKSLWSTWEAYTGIKSGWTLPSGNGVKTVYVKVKDIAGNISAINSYTIKVDTAKPTGTIIINDGDAKAGTQNVKVKVTASDDYSGVDMISFSKDGVTWDSWASYNPDSYYDYQIEGGTGPRYVYLRVRDKAGNISDSIKDDITLKDDNQGPTVSLKINNDAELTTATSVSLTISTYDDLTPIDQLQMRLSNDGRSWSTWEAVSFVKDWTLSSGEGQKNVFIQVRDASGNATTAGDTINYYVNPQDYSDINQQAEVDKEPPVIKSVKISTGATILSSNSVPLSIVVTDNMGTDNLKMSFSADGSTWTTPVSYKAKYTVSGLDFPAGYNILYVEVIDAYGNSVNDSVEFFKQ